MVYLDNMFAGLPRSPEVERMKQELLSGMEDKYLELKQEGRSENEAVGIVISEFGNIEELMEELGIQTEDASETYPVLTEEEVQAYLAAKRSAGFWTGLGVWLSSAGIAFLILMDTLFESLGSSSDQGTVGIGSVIGMSGMFVLAAVAVGMFIYSGMKLGRFEYMEKGFQLPRSLLMTIQRSKVSFALTYRVALITGVCLCILSPVFIFAGAYVNDTYAAYGVSALLATAGIGVFLFVYYGNIQGSYTTLLEEQHLNTARRKQETRVGQAVGVMIWPLATAFFLFTGLVYQRWDINWAIFPIVGILSGYISYYYENKKPS